MPSAAALLLAASLLQVPFGSSFDVRLHGSSPAPATGTIVGDLLVVTARPTDEGDRIVTLRPLALGVLTVPLAGAQPSKVEVRPTLAPGAEPRSLLVPAPAAFPWVAVAAPFLAAALVVLAVRLVRRRSRRDPLARAGEGARAARVAGRMGRRPAEPTRSHAPAAGSCGM